MGQIRHRVFLVGCPRSGTTLLQSMLASHTSIHSFPETHILDILGWANPCLRWLDSSDRDVQQSLASFFADLEWDVNFPSGRHGSEWLLWFFDQLDKISVQQKCYIWVEKTPRHLEFIPVLQEYVSGARFIHMIRSGTNTIASLYSATRQYPEFWGGEKSIDDCIQRWLYSIRLTEQWAFESNHTVAHYRTLVTRPKRTLRRMCEFLEVEFQSEMIWDFQREAPQVVRANETWKSRNFGPLMNRNNEKFFDCFSPLERRYIVRRLEEAGVSWPIY